MWLSRTLAEIFRRMPRCSFVPAIESALESLLPVLWKPFSREISRFYSDDAEGHIPNSPMAWGPQLYKSNIFFSDFHGGLWLVRLLPPEKKEASKSP